MHSNRGVECVKSVMPEHLGEKGGQECVGRPMTVYDDRPMAASEPERPCHTVECKADVPWNPKSPGESTALKEVQGFRKLQRHDLDVRS